MFSFSGILVAKMAIEFESTSGQQPLIEVLELPASIRFRPSSTQQLFDTGDPKFYYFLNSEKSKVICGLEEDNQSGCNIACKGIG